MYLVHPILQQPLARRDVICGVEDGVVDSEAAHQQQGQQLVQEHIRRDEDMCTKSKIPKHWKLCNIRLIKNHICYPDRVIMYIDTLETVFHL